MTTKIIGNQIDAVTRAIVTALSVTEQINLPSLNQTQINALGTPAFGTVVYNNSEDEAQIYKADANSGNPGWDSVGGGGPSVGENSIIRTNGTTISENLSVGPSANGGAEFTNGFSAAPITIANGFTVTIENGATWTLIGADEDLDNYRYFNNAAINEHLRLIPGATFEFGQTKERHMSFSVSGTVTLDHSMATVFSTENPTGYNGNFIVNFSNVPNQSGFVYTAQIIKRQVNGSGVISSFQVNGSTATMIRPSGFSNGTGYDIYNCFMYLSGATWNVFVAQSQFV
jgi:hypothetical protein